MESITDPWFVVYSDGTMKFFDEQPKPYPKNIVFALRVKHLEQHMANFRKEWQAREEGRRIVIQAEREKAKMNENRVANRQYLETIAQRTATLEGQMNRVETMLEALLHYAVPSALYAVKDGERR